MRTSKPTPSRTDGHETTEVVDAPGAPARARARAGFPRRDRSSAPAADPSPHYPPPPRLFGAPHS
ncbi:hypothetical protein ACFYZ4_05365 [Streptomyces sp. NPDC001513]|uniref:hypothetical protein n=1 Tax=Streptomyces sp. NPDC001513 TaxID=3364580 RepID=UPI00368813B6